MIGPQCNGTLVYGHKVCVYGAGWKRLVGIYFKFYDTKIIAELQNHVSIGLSKGVFASQFTLFINTSKVNYIPLMHFKLNELICHSLKFHSMLNVVKALISSLFSKIQTVSESG